MWDIIITAMKVDETILLYLLFIGIKAMRRRETNWNSVVCCVVLLLLCVGVWVSSLFVA